MSEVLYSARWAGPSFIEQGKDQTISVAVERDGVAAVLASGSMTLYKPSGETFIDDVAGTVAGGVFTSAVVASASTAAESLSKGWLVKIDVVIGADTFTFYNDAVLCLARLYPPIGQTDMVSRHSEAASLNAGTNLQTYIDQAWGDITIRLYTKGIPYWKWRTPSTLRDVTLSKALSFMFLDYATLMNNNDRYLKFAELYRSQYELGIEAMTSMIDVDEDNKVESEMVNSSPVIMLSGTSRTRYRR